MRVCNQLPISDQKQHRRHTVRRLSELLVGRDIMYQTLIQGDIWKCFLGL